jgi:phosphatidyl-myo-inositol alpha-mannosyltransferase
MKIGLICPYNVFRPGGVFTQILAHKEELKKRGYDVKILAPKPRETPTDYDPDLILMSESTEVNTPFHTLVDVALRIDGDEIDEVLEREKFDILHFHEPWIPRMPMQILSRSQSINVATFHAKLPESMLSKSIERVAAPYTKQVFKDLDYMTAVSDAAASYVRSLTDGTPIEIIPNGIDLEIFNPHKTKIVPEYHDDIKTILYVGRLEKRKGVIWLLKAYKKLLETQPNVRLLIAGDGVKRQMLEEYVAEHQLSRVEFLGFVSEEMKQRLLKTADLFCSPALYGESFGIVLLEAMAMGVVTVCGNNVGYASVMQERGRISLVNPKAPNEFAERLELMLFDNQIRELWCKWANDYVKEFNFPRLVDRYEEIYHELTSKKS